MKTPLTTIRLLRRSLCLVSAVLLVLATSTISVHAAESDSFDSVDNFGNDFIEAVGESDSFSQDVTAADTTMESETYQMIADEDSGSDSGSSGGGNSGGGTTATVSFESESSGGGGDRQTDRIEQEIDEAPSNIYIERTPTKPTYYKPTANATPSFKINLPTALRTSRTESAFANTSMPLAEAYQYFDAVDECDFSCQNHEAIILALQIGIVGGLIAAGFSSSILATLHIVRRTHMKKKKGKHFRFALLALLLLTFIPSLTRAENISVPALRVYNGTLFGVNGKAITTPITIRFSYWSSVDYYSSDKTASGAINASSPNYLDWTETRTVTPNAKGAFSVMLGQQSELLNLKTVSREQLRNLSLQVEVKPATSPETAYELLDVNSADPAVDRSRVTTVPFARNADLFDQHDTGTGSDDIPYLEFGGKLPISTMPEGTQAGTFTLDADDSQTTQISLTFGTTLQKKLTYDLPLGMFIFNDDVKVEGDLTVTGLINGIDIADLAANSIDRDLVTTLTPSFENAAFQGDGTENTGQLSVLYDNIVQQNYYNWSSTRPDLQDYDILLSVPVSAEFQAWQTGGAINPLTVMYRSTSADAANNKLDIQVYDTSGQPVALSGAAMNLKSTAWATTQLEFTGTPTWTQGENILIRIRMFAKNGGNMHLGTLKLFSSERVGS